jgi:membrane fusion protein, multidrug efflux system
MKKLLFILTISLMISSCGKDAAAEKAAKITALKTEREKIQQSLDNIDKELATLETKKETETLVSVSAIKDTVFSHYLDIQGSVTTRENILIQPEMPGTLVSLNIKAGQHVSKGQVLGRVDDSGMSAQLASIENQAALAKTAFERQKNLWDQKIGSEIQYLQAQTQMVSAQKSVMQMKSQLSKTNIKAPFSGTIDEVFVERGQVVAQSMQGLMRIVNLSDMFVQTTIPESYVGKLKVGSTVNVSIPSIGKNITGKVRQIGNNINPSNRSFGIEVAVPNHDNLLRPNQVAKLQIVDYIQNHAITVPTNTIQADAEKNKYVFIVDQVKNQTGIAKKAIVKIGQSSGNVTEILTGITAKDIIITEGFNSISEGMRLQY